jgi:hypothetical protein
VDRIIKEFRQYDINALFIPFSNFRGESAVYGVNKIDIYIAMNDLTLDYLGSKLSACSSWLELTIEMHSAIKNQVRFLSVSSDACYNHNDYKEDQGNGI